MRSTTVLVLAGSLVGLVGLAASPALAHKRFAKREGVECKECHESPEGGGSRNVIGQYYQIKEELPVDRSDATMKLVRDTVDRWVLEQLSVSPVIRWSYKPLAQQPSAPAPSYPPADDVAVLRRLSLDLRGTVPSPDEIKRVQSGALTLDQAVDDMLASKDFQSTFTLYHKDLIRPRTGDYNQEVSFSRAVQATVDGAKVWTSTRLPREPGQGKCGSAERVPVSPWWDRQGQHFACKDTASDAPTAVVDGKTLRCDTLEGQQSGACGCGPYLLFCYPDGVRDQVLRSQKEEMARIAMEVINTNEPYPNLLTSDWSMLDGGLEVFYAKLDGRLLELKDPDLKKPFRRVMRDPRHSGVLSTPEFLNYFYNGRRWAQRTFEAFFCHETFPDFDLLDDTKDSDQQAAVWYRDNPHLEPSINVTEARACAACHLQLDGLARVKDRWDPFGVYVDKTDRGLPIPQKAMFLGQEVDGLDGFGKALAGSEVFHDCVVNQVWTHMMGHRFEPQEKTTRVALLQQFEAKSFNFKELIRAVARTPEYRGKASLKLMTKEQYARAMGRATDVAWKIQDKSGWEIYYDKIGGMDYRKIEMRDRRPSTGHSLVQRKGAAESCDELVTRDQKRDDGKRLLVVAGGLDKAPSDGELDKTLQNLYLRALARPWAAVPDDEKKLMRGLFKTVASKGTPADGYRAVCTAVFGSEDFAIY